MSNLQSEFEDLTKLTKTNNRFSSVLHDILKFRNIQSSTKIPTFIGKGPCPFSLSTGQNNNDIFKEESSLYDANFDSRHVTKQSDKSEIISKLSFHNGEMPFEEEPNLLERYPGTKLFMLTGLPRSTYGINIPEMYLRQKKYMLEELKIKLALMQQDISPSIILEQLYNLENSEESIYLEEDDIFETHAFSSDIFSQKSNYSTDIKFILTEDTRSIYGCNIPEVYLHQKKLMLAELKRKLALAQQDISPRFIVEQLDESKTFKENIHTEEDELFNASTSHIDIFSKKPKYSAETLQEIKSIFDANSVANQPLQRQKPIDALETVIDSSKNKNGTNKNICKKVQIEDFQNDNDSNHKEQPILENTAELFWNIVLLGISITAINFLAEKIEIFLDWV